MHVYDDFDIYKQVNRKGDNVRAACPHECSIDFLRFKIEFWFSWWVDSQGNFQFKTGEILIRTVGGVLRFGLEGVLKPQNP